MPQVRFQGGKLPAQPARPQLRLTTYTTPALPAPPTSVDWLSQVTDWPMYLNDQLGDCTCAEVGHYIELVTRYGQGAIAEITDADVLNLYEKAAGYNPKKPSTDQGAYIQDILGWYLKNTVAGHKILAYASVDIGNMTEVKQAISLFGGLSLGFNFPDSAMTQFNNRQPWDVVKGAKNEGGHCVLLAGYKANGNFLVVTWGQVQEMTPAFFAKYVDEGWARITQEWVSRNGLTPLGLDLYSLGQDYAALTGKTNPIPQPVDPTPVPAPTPTPAPVPAAAADAVLAVAARTWLTAKGL